jgi:hypothetical protein
VVHQTPFEGHQSDTGHHRWQVQSLWQCSPSSRCCNL